MEHRFDKSTGKLMIQMPREVDHHSALQLRQETDFLMSRYPVRGLVFDFKHTVFMDSSGIGVILSRCRSLRFAGGRTTAICLNAQIQRFFRYRDYIKWWKWSSKEEVMEKEMKMEFTSQSENEGFARVAVGAFIASLNPTVDELADIKTAVSEAVTNAIIHGYDQKEGRVWITCQVIEHTVEICVIDTGKGIPDIDKAREPLYTTRPELERSGMGFTFMEAFMDQVWVASSPGQGTRVTMRKSIGRA